MATRDDTTLPERVRELVVPLAEELGIDLIDVEVKGQQGRRVIRLIADSVEPGAGIDVDQIATLSRQVGHELDEVDLVAGAYTLEVTSPGATRPLRRPADFRRNLGREVDVLRSGDDGAPMVRGRVSEVSDDTITVETDQGLVRLGLDEIDHGKVVLPW